MQVQLKLNAVLRIARTIRKSAHQTVMNETEETVPQLKECLQPNHKVSNIWQSQAIVNYLDDYLVSRFNVMVVVHVQIYAEQ